jgi:arylsulfatase A-like enzyme
MQYSDKRPNVLVIHTDQQSWWTLSCYGSDVIHTPNIDRLAQEGAQLTQFFVNSAVCTPSRGTFLTGRYPHAHGAYQNNLCLNRDEVTFAEVFRRNGYETGYVGKWHLDGRARPGWVHAERSMGFEDARFMFNRGHWKKIKDTEMGDCEPTIFPYSSFGDERTYPTDWLTDKTIDFLNADRDRPFCFMLSIPDPHTPFRPRAPYDSAFNPDEMDVPESYDEDSPFEPWAQNQSGKPDREKLKQYKAWYLGAVKLIDDNVGRLIDCLETAGILDDTVVVFTSDHGEYMGEHGLMGKNMIYETAHRVPFLIRWPEKIAAASVVDRVVASVDFQQTLLGLVGLEACGREQGRDASELLRGQDIAWDDAAYIHHPSNQWAGVYTDKHLYATHSTGYSMLFDRAGDPDQVRNRVDEDAAEVAQLRGEVVRHLESCRAPQADWLS